MRQDAKLWSSALSLAALAGCGRTPIYCARVGASRPCDTECGVGIEVCDGFEYGTCGRPCENRCGEGTEVCIEGQWQACDAPTPAMRGTVRDHRDDHPDFQTPFSAGVEPGLLAPQLDGNDQPIYLGGSGTRTTTGEQNFASWFNDAPGINASRAISIDLEHLDGDNTRIGLQQTEFFPIDGQLLGNEGRPHNYHFTLELEHELEYFGGEVLEFAGDDDLWVFINRRLAVDLGGTHSANETAVVDLDAQAGWLGLTPGQSYPIHVFFAERHTTSSALIFDMPADMLACPDGP